jgi:hypothetical protein
MQAGYYKVCSSAALFFTLASLAASAQVTVPLPGRSVNKLLADYLRPQVYALNQANGSVAGTLLALNANNGAILNEISVNLNPTDMAISPAGDVLYVINAGSRTISKVDLTTFSVVAEKNISTPSTYNPSNPLYLVADNSGTVYFTDGAWGPEIYSFDYASATQTLILNTGGNQFSGAGGLVLSKNASILYIWQQYGWSAGYAGSAIQSYGLTNNVLTPVTTGPGQSRDPLNTPIFLDAGERWVFNKVQKVSATNTAVLLTQFTDNIYGISVDGSVAFGLTQVFNAQTGISITNLPFSTTVVSLSGDQKKLFRYNSSSSSVVIYDMASIASVSGTTIIPTPANGTVVALAPTNLLWTPSVTALSYDVYFGTNQAAVGAANTASPLYLGRITGTSIVPGQQLAPGSTYYWRVDSIGFNATNQGPAWSFTVSPIAITPTQVSVGGIAGYNPANVSLSLTSGVPTAWSAGVTGSPWVTLSSTNGTTPSAITLSFNTAAFAVGTYTNNIEFTVGALKVDIPVILNVAALNITKMAADRVRPYVYALQPPALSGQNGRVLFINTQTGNIDLTLPTGINPVDLSINYAESRLYIASWTEGATYVVDLNSQSLLPSLNLGTDVYKINAGGAGRIMAEGEDQWVSIRLIDTGNGSTLLSGIVREGDGEYDPSGRYYYHVDNNSSGAAIAKFDMITNTFTSVAGAGPHYYYGSRNLVMSQDGSRLFWTSAVYDANLVDLGVIGAEIYACSTNGSVAFSGSQAYDSATRQVIYNLPVSSSVCVVDGKNQRFWYFNSANATLGSIALSVIQSPSITQQPAANTSVGVGGAVYLTVTAMGIAPLSYQWTMFGTNLPGVTNYFLSIPGIQPSQQGNYQVVVSNPFGAVTSSVAQVTVLIPPSIVSQSASTNVVAGQTFSLSVTPAGTSPFTYRWMFENANINGGTAQTLAIANAQPVNEGIYRVVVGNSAGSITGGVISVRVLPSVPVIVSNPVSLNLPASSNASFSVSAIGSQPLGYQWYFNNAPVPGATTAQYNLAGVQSSNSGNYKVVVTNGLGSATSAVATLTVTPLAPYFVTQPVGASVSAGTSRTLTGLANGSQPIGYQWQRNGTNVSGASQTSLALTNLVVADSGAYTLVASNIAGVSTSAVAQLTVFQNATLLQGLTNQVVDINSTVSLAINALGSPTLVYSWQLNGQAIAGSGPSLTLTNIQLSQGGYYRVTVTNQYGSVSSTGRVSVLGWPSSVTAWGDNSGGQTNVPSNLRDIVAIAGGDYHSVGLHHDGSLIAWGYNGDGQTSVPSNALRFVSVAAGAAHNLGILENGSVVAWGRNDAGQRTVPSSASNGVVTVAAGDSHSLALLSSGTVVGWGDNSLGQISVPQGLNGVRAIAAGRNHSLALRTNGVVVGWGFNTYGQASPPGLSNAMGIAAGYLHSAALLSNGTVVVWGDNSFGQGNVPAAVSNVVAIAAGDFHTLALRGDGTVVGWGNDSYGQIEVPVGLTNVFSVGSGNYHGLALTPALGLLQAARDPAGLVVRWNGIGTLQWAPTPLGPFTDVGWQGTSYTNFDMSAPAKFFRLHR